MNQERINRWKKAGEYQKKAIYALMPEWMEGHMEVIEKEMSLMLQDAVREFVLGGKKSEKKHEEKQKGEPEVRKVDIV